LQTVDFGAMHSSNYSDRVYVFAKWRVTGYPLKCV
jgi:hypothetical protein